MNIPIPLTTWATLIGCAILVTLSVPALVLCEQAADAEDWPRSLRNRIKAGFVAIDLAVTACIIWIAFLCIAPYLEAASLGAALPANSPRVADPVVTA